MPPLAAFLPALLAAVPLGAQPAPKFVQVFPTEPANLSCVDATIDRHDGHDVRLMIYTPKAPGTYRALLDIHGGGWRERQVENDRALAERLASRGFLVAIVDYRLSIDARYPAALWDCKSAVRYLRAHAGGLRLDPRRIGVIGGSAGGHLAGLLATTNGLPEFEGDGPDRDQSSAVQAAVVMASAMDLEKSEPLDSSSYARDFFGGPRRDLPEVYRSASPVDHVTRATPPIIFIEGERDGLKAGRAEMQDKLRGYGITTGLSTLKFAPHPFWMSQPWLDQTVAIAADFFEREL